MLYLKKKGNTWPYKTNQFNSFQRQNPVSKICMSGDRKCVNGTCDSKRGMSPGRMIWLAEILTNHNPRGNEATVPSGRHQQLLLFVQFTCCYFPWKIQFSTMSQTQKRFQIILPSISYSVAIKKEHNLISRWYNIYKTGHTLRKGLTIGVYILTIKCQRHLSFKISKISTVVGVKLISDT